MHIRLHQWNPPKLFLECCRWKHLLTALSALKPLIFGSESSPLLCCGVKYKKVFLAPIHTRVSIKWRHLPFPLSGYLLSDPLSHCPKSNPNFRDITVEENKIQHEIFRVVSRFPATFYVLSRKIDYLSDSACLSYTACLLIFVTCHLFPWFEWAVYRYLTPCIAGYVPSVWAILCITITHSLTASIRSPLHPPPHIQS